MYIKKKKCTIILIITVFLVLIVVFSYLLLPHLNKLPTTDNNTDQDINDVEILLDYQQKVSYPYIKQFDITILDFPKSAVYCSASTNYGRMSSDKIVLENENQITYYFPNKIDYYVFDTVTLTFYDDNGDEIYTKELCIEFDKDKKEYNIFEKIIK